MRTCGNCGFVQPPDKYCARCGIDMDSFVPQKPPFVQRLFKSTAFRFLVVALILGFGTSLLLDQRSSRFEEEDDFVLIDPTPKKKKTFGTQNAKSVETLGRAKPEALVQPIAAASLESSTEVAAEPMTLSVHYKLVTQDGMNELLQRSIAQDSSGEISSGIVPSVQSLSDVEKFVEMDTVSTTGNRALERDKNLIYESSARKVPELDEYEGMRLIVIPSRVERDEAQFSVNITGNFFDIESEEPPSNEEVRSFNTTFRIAPGEIGFVSGFLPHTPPRVTETDTFFVQGPLSVFKNELFVDNAAEFVIFFTVNGLENSL